MLAFIDIMVFMEDNQPKVDQPKAKQPKVVLLLKILILCIMSAIGNAALCHLVTNVANVPLYMDTMFTIAMCFSAGMFAGVLTGAIFSPLCFYFVTRYILGLSVTLSLVRNIYLICIVVEAVLVCLFYSKMKTKEAAFLDKTSRGSPPSLNSFIGIGTELLVLVALDCIAVSITGGIIDYVLTLNSAPRTFSPEDTFKLVLLRNNVPVLATSILSRIPINIIDRFVAVFGGYGISLLFRKWLNKGSGEVF
jgi:hypothetical protein